MSLQVWFASTETSVEGGNDSEPHLCCRGAISSCNRQQSTVRTPGRNRSSSRSNHRDDVKSFRRNRKRNVVSAYRKLRNHRQYANCRPRRHEWFYRLVLLSSL